MQTPNLRIKNKPARFGAGSLPMVIPRQLKTVSLLVVGACAGPQVPAAFAPNSAASPAATAPPRPPVAAVLAHENPLEAPACADAKGRPTICPEAEGGHEHVGHTEKAGAAAGHEAHEGKPAEPAKAHDHSQHGAPRKGEKRQESTDPGRKPENGQHHHHQH
jgi:hypothetical protein